MSISKFANLVFELPLAPLAILVAVVFVGAYWLGCTFLSPLLKKLIRSNGGENDIVGALLATFGVLYGLLVSLVAVAAYQNVNLAESQAGSEASALLALHRDIAEYPASFKSSLNTKLLDYCDYIIAEEWPLLRQGVRPPSVHEKLRPIFRELVALDHESRREEIIQLKALEHFELMSDLGRKRRYSSDAAIPAIMWYVVIVGTLINFGLMWSFHMRFVAHLFLGGMVAFFLGALILLIAVLDRPYRSVEFGVSPTAFEVVREIMMQEEALERKAILGGR
ncbi:MAG: hypothetical protein ACK5OB_17390 [Pirellula sp.]